MCSSGFCPGKHITLIIFFRKHLFLLRVMPWWRVENIHFRNTRLEPHAQMKLHDERNLFFSTVQSKHFYTRSDVLFFIPCIWLLFALKEKHTNSGDSCHSICYYSAIYSVLGCFCMFDLFQGFCVIFWITVITMVITSRHNPIGQAIPGWIVHHLKTFPSHQNYTEFE